jgi:hypothetical protein
MSDRMPHRPKMPSAPNPNREPNRRDIVRSAAAGGAVLGFAVALPCGAAFALSPVVPRGQIMTDRANTFLATLDPKQREAVTFDFGGRRRQRWNYMLGSAFAPGLPLERMREPQKVAALELLNSALSQEGTLKAERIMLQQDIMRDEWGKGSPDRNRERFSVMIFGAPGDASGWGWRFEGHHLSLSFTLKGDTLVSVTPSAFASEPNTVPSGPHRGMVVLDEEEALGRKLFLDLAPKVRERALVSRRSYANILATAGREDRVQGSDAGIPIADLPQAQQDLARKLVEVQAVENFASDIAEAQVARLDEEDFQAARFAWAGADLDGPSIYYRIKGQAFAVEFATVWNQPQHHHTVRHDFERNLGRHAL